MNKPGKPLGNPQPGTLRTGWLRSLHAPIGAREYAPRRVASAIEGSGAIGPVMRPAATARASFSLSHRKAFSKGWDRRSFLWLSISVVVFVFLGFSRTFFFSRFFGVATPTRFIVFHGVLMSGWVVLLAVQSGLAVKKQVGWHRWLGVIGTFYAALIVAVGCLATLGAAAREIHSHSAYLSGQLDVLALELTQMLLFGSLVAVAVALRHRPAWHKRLMVIATLCILPNVIVRIAQLFPAEFFSHNYAILATWIVLVLVVTGIDTWRNRRVHPAYGIGATAAVVVLSAAYFVGISEVWVHFSTGFVTSLKLSWPIGG